QWRGVERQEPQRGDPEILQVIELAREPLEIADPVIVGVKERLDVQLVDDRVLVPKRVLSRGLRERGGSRQKRGGYRSIVGRRHISLSIACWIGMVRPSRRRPCPEETPQGTSRRGRLLRMT